MVQKALGANDKKEWGGLACDSKALRHEIKSSLGIFAHTGDCFNDYTFDGDDQVPWDVLDYTWLIKGTEMGQKGLLDFQKMV